MTTSLVLATVLATVHPNESSTLQSIYGADYFEGLPATVIDFELDGSGAPIEVVEPFAQLMPPGEYAAQGVTFDPAVWWVDDTGACFDGALAQGGTPPLAIPGGTDEFDLLFDPPVRSFGVWVVHLTDDGMAPTFEAFDGLGARLGGRIFEGAFVDGTVGPSGQVSFGFLGLASDVPMARVRFVKLAAQFDRLTFSTLRRDAPHLAANGVCRGTFAVTVTAADPGARLVFLASGGSGSASLPLGACGLVATSLAPPVTVVDTALADAAGEALIEIFVPASAAGATRLQAIELLGCTATQSVIVGSCPGPSCTPDDA